MDDFSLIQLQFSTSIIAYAYIYTMQYFIKFSYTVSAETSLKKDNGQPQSSQAIATILT